MAMFRTPIAACAALTALLLATSCSSPSAGPTSGAPPTTTSSNPSPALAAASPSAAAAAPSPSPAAAGAQTVTVNLTDSFQFQPSNVTIPRGATINWVNTGQSPHTVTDDPSKAASPSDAVLPSGAQAWDSGILNGGATFSHTFDTPGQYTYFCTPHEALGMVGHITVTP